MGKIYNNDLNVYDASIKRLNYLYDHFEEEEVWLSLSGGKDSSVCYNLLKEVAIKRGIKTINLLIIDLEGHYKLHEEYLKRIVSDNDINIKGYWLCLPFHLSNASSMYQPKWLCWDEDQKNNWIRPIPDTHITIDNNNNPFGDYFRKGMEFEEFIISFPQYLTEVKGLKKVAQIIGIRTQESYNRYLKMKVTKNREFFNGNQWILKQKSTGYETYSVHPIYDWLAHDVWKYSHGKDYNKVYDKMYLSGYSLNAMRICQPYGEEQRDNLDLFAKIEPETWARIQNRVQGANFAMEYKGKNFIKGAIKLPENIDSWESWTRLILNSMPPFLREHYLSKINVFLRWWRKEIYNDIPHVYSNEYQSNEAIDNDGLYVVDIYDSHEQDTKKLKPSWRRIAKVLIKGDYLCKNLTFSATKKEFEKLQELKDKYNKL